MKPKHEYVVGYAGDGNCVYGKDNGEASHYAMPLTAHQAICCLANFAGDSKTIFRLVPVSEKQVRAAAAKNRRTK